LAFLSVCCIQEYQENSQYQIRTNNMATNTDDDIPCWKWILSRFHSTISLTIVLGALSVLFLCLDISQLVKVLAGILADENTFPRFNWPQAVVVLGAIAGTTTFLVALVQGVFRQLTDN